MKYLLAAMGLIAVIAGLVACTDALAKDTRFYCIGLVFILLGLITTAYIFMDAPRFGEESSEENFPEQHLQVNPLRR